MRRFISILAIITGIFMLTGCGSSDGIVNKNPETLIGGWYQTNSKQTGTNMTADIDAGGIQINMSTRDGSGGIFWLGTFDGTHHPSGSFKILSHGDTQAMSNMLLASNEKTKIFSYKNGVITFGFSIMHVKSTIRMEKTVSQRSDKPKDKTTVPLPAPKTIGPRRTPPYKPAKKVVVPPKTSKNLK